MAVGEEERFDAALRLNTLTSINAFSNLPPQNPHMETSSLALSVVMADRWRSSHQLAVVGVAPL